MAEPRSKARRWIAILLVFALAVLGVATWYFCPTMSATSAHLNETTIDIDFAQTKLGDALASIEEKTRRSSPRMKNFRVIYIEGGKEATPPSDVLIDLKLKNVPVSEALRYVATLANCYPHYHAGWVDIWPQWDDVVETQNWFQSYVHPGRPTP